MFALDKSYFVSLSQVKSCYDMLSQVVRAYFSFGQFMSG